MEKKKTAIILLVLLICLIVLLFLRACDFSFGGKSSSSKPEEWSAPLESVDTSTQSYDISEIPEDDISLLTDLPLSLEDNQPKKEIIPETKKESESKPNPQQTVKQEKAVVQAKKEETPKALTREEVKDSLPKSVTKKRRPEERTVPKYVNKSGFKPFYVYEDIGSKNNHFYPSGLMGDIGSIKIDQGWQENPYSGKTCIKITYTPRKGRVTWAGNYWTEPANNWGDKGLGFNLAGAERVSFWVRGEKGGELISNFIMGGIQGKKSEDSDSRAIGPLELSTEWEQYIIYIEDANLTNIIGGFCFTITVSNNPFGAVFYLDEILYE